MSLGRGFRQQPPMGPHTGSASSGLTRGGEGSTHPFAAALSKGSPPGRTGSAWRRPWVRPIRTSCLANPTRRCGHSGQQIDPPACQSRTSPVSSATSAPTPGRATAEPSRRSVAGSLRMIVAGPLLAHSRTRRILSGRGTESVSGGVSSAWMSSDSKPRSWQAAKCVDLSTQLCQCDGAAHP